MNKFFQKFVFAIFFIPIYFFSYENSNTHPLSDDFADLVSELSPSVVNVFTVQKPKQPNENQMPFDNIPPQFRDFFKNFPPGFPTGQGIIACLTFSFCKFEIIFFVSLRVSNPI